MLYLWMKAAHIFAIISWMAMLLYLPRLMVYHCGATSGDVQSETFKVMQRRLLKGIGTPAMIASWILGLYLIVDGGYLIDGTYWAHAKLVLVFALSVCHMRLAWHVKRFADDKNEHSDRYFRILNEVPAIIMVGIVILVVVRPF
ncbi:MAG: protoporphyrinogen oxidase HemJ [Hyphomicrobiales bacterium]